MVNVINNKNRFIRNSVAPMKWPESLAGSLDFVLWEVGVTKGFKQGTDMMEVICWEGNSFSNGEVGLEEGEVGGRKTS